MQKFRMKSGFTLARDENSWTINLYMWKPHCMEECWYKHITWNSREINSNKHTINIWEYFLHKFYNILHKFCVIFYLIIINFMNNCYFQWPLYAMHCFYRKNRFVYSLFTQETPICSGILSKACRRFWSNGRLSVPYKNSHKCNKIIPT